jgi:putative flippase GtrA
LNNFLRFAFIGVVGFLVDAGCLQIFIDVFDFSPYVGRVISFILAASATWILNRSFTFGVKVRPSCREWLGYLALMLFGGVINYLTFIFAYEYIDLVRQYPVIGVAMGSLAGLVANFLSSSKLFRPYK